MAHVARGRAVHGELPADAVGRRADGQPDRGCAAVRPDAARWVHGRRDQRPVRAQAPADVRPSAARPCRVPDVLGGSERARAGLDGVPVHVPAGGWRPGEHDRTTAADLRDGRAPTRRTGDDHRGDGTVHVRHGRQSRRRGPHGQRRTRGRLLRYGDTAMRFAGAALDGAAAQVRRAAQQHRPDLGRPPAAGRAHPGTTQPADAGDAAGDRRGQSVHVRLPAAGARRRQALRRWGGDGRPARRWARPRPDPRRPGPHIASAQAPLPGLRLRDCRCTRRPVRLLDRAAVQPRILRAVPLRTRSVGLRLDAESAGDRVGGWLRAGGRARRAEHVHRGSADRHGDHRCSGRAAGHPPRAGHRVAGRSRRAHVRRGALPASGGGIAEVRWCRGWRKCRVTRRS